MLLFVRSRISYGFVCVTSELCTAECQMQNIWNFPECKVEFLFYDEYSKIYSNHTQAFVYICTFIEGVLGLGVNLIFKRLLKIV